jgi:hypothetical protein
MLLTVMAVAGLPVIVCVSEAHGTAVELGGLYTAHHDSSEPHGAVSDSSDDAFGSGCTDFRLDRGILVEQVRLKQPTGLPILNNDGPLSRRLPRHCSLLSSLPTAGEFCGSTDPSYGPALAISGPSFC